MADITVTAASVRPLNNAFIRRYNAGGSGAVGNSVYLASDGDVEVTDADALATSKSIGVVVGVNGQVGATTFVAGDALDVVRYGPVAGFSSLTPGGKIFASGTAGALANTAGTYPHIIGYVDAAGTLFVDPHEVSTGFVNLPLSAFRLISSNDIPNTAGDAGVLSSNSAPAYIRVNAATDKALRIAWAASGVVGVTQSFLYPPDLDDTMPVTVKLLAAMAGATDTPTIAVNYFEGVGDTNAGGNTAAVTGTTVATYSRAIAASDVGAAPAAAAIELVPAAHGTDALYVYAVWVEYTRK